MVSRRIISPLAWGNGAYIVHRLLEEQMVGYRVLGYHPYWTLFPFILPVVAPVDGADLVHTTVDYAAFFHKRSIPLVVSFQNYVLDRWMRSYSSLPQILHYSTDLRLWIRLALRKARAITAVSQYTANLVKEELKISDNIKVIYNGVDANRFTPHPGKKPNRKVIKVFYSGNLSRRKGAQWLPLIAKGLNRDVQIFYTQGLHTHCSLAPEARLKCVGPVPFEDMPERYREMDLLLMPTVREGLSLAVLEAMACGLPVVASDCSSLPEQIDDGKGGFLCPVGDVPSFVEKINRLAESPRLRREMGEYNRSKVEQLFTLDRMVNGYGDLFKEIIG